MNRITITLVVELQLGEEEEVDVLVEEEEEVIVEEEAVDMGNSEERHDELRPTSPA